MFNVQYLRLEQLEGNLGGGGGVRGLFVLWRVQILLYKVVEIIERLRRDIVRFAF